MSLNYIDMLTRDEESLLVFDNFVVDRNLPKYAKPSDVSNVNEGANFVVSGIASNVIGNNVDGTTVEGVEVDSAITPWYTKLYNKLFGRKPRYSVNDFFKALKHSPLEIDIIEQRLDGYKRLLRLAEDAGQTALADEMKDNIKVVKTESQLIATGYTKVITEDQIIQFYKETEKGLRLDWVKNFTRLIPPEIVKQKKRLDELGVFDNYLVLHYDPNRKSYRLTKAEKEKKKDPILFGVIKDSRKLYFVADWIDEVCDLTMEDLVKEFGEEAINKNNLDINIYNGIEDK